MLIREDAHGRWIVSQPAHAWVAGQLALAWGNPPFSTPQPSDAVALGAVLHDIGWLNWEQHPTLNLDTGLPHTFMELPTNVHLDIWEPASRLALPFGRYAALLVSLHGTYLYGFHNYERDSPEEARRARAFVAREKAFQEDCVVSLRADPAMGTAVLDDVIERNRRLIALWDGMSLAICGNARTERTYALGLSSETSANIRVVPTIEGFVIDPWPFKTDALSFQVDARYIDRTFTTQAELDRWMTSSKVGSVAIRLSREPVDATSAPDPRSDTPQHRLR